MKGVCRLYFVAVHYSIMLFTVAETLAFEGMVMEVGITEVCMVVFCTVEYFTLFAPCLSLT